MDAIARTRHLGQRLECGLDTRQVESRRIRLREGIQFLLQAKPSWSFTHRSSQLKTRRDTTLCLFRHSSYAANSALY